MEGIKYYIKKTNYYLDIFFRALNYLVLFCIGILVVGYFLGELLEWGRLLLFNLYQVAIVFLILLWSLLYYGFSFKNITITKHEVKKDDFKTFKFRNFVSALIILFIVLLYKYPDFLRVYCDGIYCAEVDVLSNRSGVYTLTVEVEEGNVNVIYWNNGGWLDETHYDVYDAHVDGDGMAFFTDDRGREFIVKLKNRGDCR